MASRLASTSFSSSNHVLRRRSSSILAALNQHQYHYKAHRRLHSFTRYSLTPSPSPLASSTSWITSRRGYHDEQPSSRLSQLKNRLPRNNNDNDLPAFSMTIPPLTTFNPNSVRFTSLLDSSSSIDLSSVLSKWMAKIPKGFGNFFPKEGDGKGQNDANGSSSSTDAETSTGKSGSKNTNTTNASFKSKDDEQNNRQDQKKDKVPPPPPPEESDPQNIPALIALVLMVMAARRFMTDDENGPKDGKEITFVDFRNHLLHTGQVEKIIVVNSSLARVVLRPGSRGIPPSATSSSSVGAGGSTMMSSDWNSSTSSSTSLHSETDGRSNGGEGDKTILEFDKPSSDATGTGGSLSSTSSSSRRMLSSQTPSYHFRIGSIESFEEKLSKSQSHIHPREWIPVQYVNEVNLLVEFIKLTPMIAMLSILYLSARGLMGGGGIGGGGGPGGMGGIFQVGKSNAKKINPESVKVDFSDVAGCKQAKQEIMEFVDFLKDSSRFTKLGAKIPKGALLCGPPGTGKTLLAKAVAGEAGVPFFSTSGSDFIEMFVGVGPSRVRDLFKEARTNAPCIVFIDEIDAVGRQRGRGGFSGGNDERENTLNQLLVEMDGFTTTTGVVVLAGTNRVDILDQALTRPGRFDRQITVDKPDLQGRKEIFNVHLKGLTLEGTMDEYSGRLAGLTPGFAGADIANLCNEAAIVAARRKAESVSIEDFEKATDRVIGGLESNKIMSDHEREIVAYHEAGHAVAGWFLEHADPLLKVTIIPRSSGALGFAQYLPKEVFLRTQQQIMDIVCMTLAGRAAEQVFFGRVTTGASDDLKRVTQMVYSTIQTYGMNSRVGQLAYPRDNDGGMPGDKPYSEATAEAMDEEAREIVDAAYQRTIELITEKKDEVEKIAQLLLHKETITHDDLVDEIGQRPFQGDEQYQEYISSRHERHVKSKVNEEENDDGADSLSKNETNPIDSDNNNSNNGGLTPGLA